MIEERPGKLRDLDEFGVLQELVLEAKVCLNPPAPSTFIVEINIGALLIVICDRLGFLIALEPGEILFVKPPRLLLEFPCGEISKRPEGGAKIQ